MTVVRGSARIWLKHVALAALPALVVIAGASRPPLARAQTPAPTPFNANTGTVVRVTYPPGWNLVSAPGGAALPQSPRPVYTYPAGATAYETVNPASTTPGYGYWVYYDALTPATYPGGGPESFTRPIPAGQWILIGNPRGTLTLVTGADAIETYDPVQGYESTTVLQPGQGAWAFSYSGGTLTFTNLAP